MGGMAAACAAARAENGPANSTAPAVTANTTVTVSFSVSDENQHPLEQAQISIILSNQISPNQPPPNRPPQNQPLPNQVIVSATTDKNGNSSIAVPPGSYMLRVTKNDYISNESALEIASSSDIEKIDVVLSHIGLSKQQITVQGSSSDPVTEQSASPSSISVKQAEQSPTRPQTVKDALPLVPGVVRENNGSIAIAGYSENNSTLLVNSVDVTDPSTGEFGLSVPIDSVETINVAEMPYLAQYGRFIAGVVTTETKRGGDKWNFSLNDPLPDFRIRSGHLAGMRDMSPRLNFGGPLLANRLFITEGVEYLVYKDPVRTLPFPFNETRSRAINSFTQLDAILSPSNTLTASFHDSPHSLVHAGLDFFNPQPVTPNANFHESTITVIDRASLNGGILQSTIANTRVSSSISPNPQSTGQMVLTPLGNQGSYFASQSRLATRFAWMESWSPHAYHLVGSHYFQFGSILSHSEDQGQWSAQPVEIQDASGHELQLINFSQGRSFDLSDYAPALYAQDHWLLNSQFALDLGVRFEAQTITFTTRTAPRAGFVWAPGENRKTVLRGGAGIFYNEVPLGVYAFNSYPEQTVTSFDASGVASSPVHFTNVLQQAGSSEFPFVDRGLRNGNFSPYSAAWNVELEHEFSRFLLVRSKYLQSSAHDLLKFQPQLLDAQNSLALGGSGGASTRQWEFTARVGANPQRQFFFSYVRQYAHGDFNDANGYTGNFPFPIVHQDLTASLPDEIPNRFLLWGTYSLPRKFALNPRIEWRDGFPYQPVNVLQQYLPFAGGVQPRFPRYFSFDLLVSKDIQITKKHAVRFSFPMTNLTNHFNALEVHSNTADPQYGTFFGTYPRRILIDFDFLN